MSKKKSATLTRIISAVVALPLYIFLLSSNQILSIPILIASIIISMLCLYEFYKIAKTETCKPFIFLGMFAAFIINLLMYIHAYGNLSVIGDYLNQHQSFAYLLGIIAVLITIMAFVQIFKRPLKGAISSMAVTVFGLFLIVIPYAHIILMKSLTNGIFYVMILHVAVMMNDSFAYFGGVLFGKHKANIPVSPNKSVEGYVTGMIFCVASMMLTSFIFSASFGKDLFSMLEAALLGVALSVLGFTGDLIESAVKRDGEIKDSGSIIPGHGGMWDVFDAVIFSLPLFYYYLKIKGL